MTTFDAGLGIHMPTDDDDLQARVDLLRQLGLGGEDPQFDEFAALIARDAGVPYAMVNLITTHQYFAGLYAAPGQDGRVDMDRTWTKDPGFCPFVLSRKLALVLPDVTAHPRFATNTVVGELGIRTYAGAPLFAPDGTVLGTVCFVGTEKRPQETGKATLAFIKERSLQVTEIIRQRVTQQHT